MNKLTALMKVDIISLTGRKNSTPMLMLVMLAIAVVGGLVIFPFGVVIGIFTVFIIANNIFTIESKNGYEKLFGMLPIDRRSIVYARYLLTGISTLVLSVPLYGLGALSLRLRLFETLSANEVKYADISLAIMPEISELSAFSFTFFAYFLLGCIISALTMRFAFLYGVEKSETRLSMTILKIAPIIAVIVLIMRFGFKTRITEAVLEWLKTVQSTVPACIIMPIAGLAFTAVVAAITAKEYENLEL